MMQKKFLYIIGISVLNGSLTLYATPGSANYPRTFFSPDDNIREILCSYIRAEQESCKCAVYWLSDARVARELIAAHHRGVKICVVTEKSAAEYNASKVPLLKNAGVTVCTYDGSRISKKGNEYIDSIMHNKFLLFGRNKNNKKLVWTGSFNLTNRASDKNQENVIVMDDTTAYTKYDRQFDRLVARARNSLPNRSLPSRHTSKTKKHTKPSTFKRPFSALSSALRKTFLPSQHRVRR